MPPLYDKVREEKGRSGDARNCSPPKLDQTARSRAVSDQRERERTSASECMPG